MKLKKWILTYERRSFGVGPSFKAVHEFVTNEDFTPHEALRVGIGAVQANLAWFYKFESAGTTEKLP